MTVGATLGPDLDEDRKWMARALELAALGRGLTSPNPMVGAVVVRDGRLLGEGHHVRAGAPHAEVVALTQAGPAARGATLYVSLEPCNHRGRTPPCAAAIVGAGLARVVAAVGDPNPRAGGGADALRAAGVAVEMGCLAEEASALNRVFLTAMRERRPHVTLKCAMTLDGKTAAFDRSSRWITGEEARGEAHRLRSEADAIAVGIGTALADDPALTVRLGRLWPREPWRVVVDSHARLPVTAQVIRAGAPARALVAVTGQAPPDRVAALEARGATVLACKGEGGRVDLADLCSRLLGLDVLGLLVEGGGEIAAAFLEAHLVDRVAFFVAPLLIGGRSAPTPVEGAGRTVGAAVRLRSVRVRAVGEDWLIEGEVASRERRG